MPSWSCPTCTFENHADLPSCEMCGASPSVSASASTSALVSTQPQPPQPPPRNSLGLFRQASGVRPEICWICLNTSALLNNDISNIRLPCHCAFHYKCLVGYIKAELRSNQDVIHSVDGILCPNAKATVGTCEYRGRNGESYKMDPIDLDSIMAYAYRSTELAVESALSPDESATLHRWLAGDISSAAVTFAPSSTVSSPAQIDSNLGAEIESPPLATVADAPAPTFAIAAYEPLTDSEISHLLYSWRKGNINFSTDQSESIAVENDGGGEALIACVDDIEVSGKRNTIRETIFDKHNIKFDSRGVPTRQEVIACLQENKSELDSIGYAPANLDSMKYKASAYFNELEKYWNVISRERMAHESFDLRVLVAINFPEFLRAGAEDLPPFEFLSTPGYFHEYPIDPDDELKCCSFFPFVLHRNSDCVQRQVTLQQKRLRACEVYIDSGKPKIDTSLSYFESAWTVIDYHLGEETYVRKPISRKRQLNVILSTAAKMSLRRCQAYRRPSSAQTYADEKKYSTTCRIFLKSLLNAHIELEALANHENQRPVACRIEEVQAEIISFQWISMTANINKKCIQKRMNRSMWFKRFILAHNRNIHEFQKVLESFDMLSWTKQQRYTFYCTGTTHKSFKRTKNDKTSTFQDSQLSVEFENCPDLIRTPRMLPSVLRARQNIIDIIVPARQERLLQIRELRQRREITFSAQCVHPNIVRIKKEILATWAQGRYLRRMVFPFELSWKFENMQGRLAREMEREMTMLFKDLSPLPTCLSPSVSSLDRVIKNVSASDKLLCKIMWVPEDETISLSNDELNSRSACSMILSEFAQKESLCRRFYLDDKCVVHIDLQSWVCSISCTRFNVTKTAKTLFAWGKLFKLPDMSSTNSCATLKMVLEPLPLTIDNAILPTRALRYLQYDLRADKEAVITAVRQNGFVLQYASENLRADRDVVIAAISQNGRAIEHASGDLRSDFEIAFCAVTSNGRALEYVTEKLRANKELVTVAVEQNSAAAKFISNTLFDDLVWVETLFETCPRLKDNKFIVRAAVARNAHNLKFASHRLPGYFSLAKAAVLQDENVFQYLSEPLKCQQDFILSLLSSREDLKSHKSFMSEAITNCPAIFEQCSDSLKSNREFVLLATKLRGSVLQFAHKKFCSDREVVLAAAGNDGFAIQYAAYEFRLDREIALAVVSSAGTALRYFDNDSILMDREVVFCAVCNDGAALEYAPEVFRSDREIVLTAVQSCGLSLQYACESLVTDKEIVVSAIKQNYKAYLYAPEHIRNDISVLEHNLETLTYTNADFQEYNKEFLVSAISLKPSLLQCTVESVRRDRDIVICGYLRAAKITKSYAKYDLTDVDKKWISILKDLHQCNLKSFSEKRDYLEKKLSRFRKESRFDINVSRDAIFQSVAFQIGSAPMNYLYGKFGINFVNEPGYDAGGLRREFYQLFANDLFNPNYALFTSIDGATVQPNSLSAINEEHLTYFHAAGRVFGKAIFDRELLPVHFTQSFYKLLLGIRPGLTDIQAIDPNLFESFKKMLDSNNVEEWDLDFTIAVETFDQTPQYQDLTDLSRQPSAGIGDHILITDKNKELYVSKAVEFRLKRVIYEQTKAFQRGVYDIIPLALLQIFTPSELELLHCGIPHVNVDDLQVNTIYRGGYDTKSNCIRWFWEIVRSYDEEYRGKLLQFVTGTSRVPHDGFANLPGMHGSINRFSISRVFDINHLPTAHTCYNQLDLPEYLSKEILDQNLRIALTLGSTGFGFS